MDYNEIVTIIIPFIQQLNYNAVTLSVFLPRDALARYISGSNEPLRRYGHSRILGHMEPPFREEGEIEGDQRWHRSKERWWFTIMLSIVTVVLSVTIRPQFAIECLQRSNQQGVVHFGPKFPCVPLGADP